jgi:cytochrome c peroxidase
MNTNKLRLMVGSAVVLSAAVVGARDPNEGLRDTYDRAARRTSAVEFPQLIGNSGNAVVGQRKFGFADDGVTLDSSQALFQGFSVIAGNVVSNGRSCASCHRAGDAFFGMPAIPVTSSVAPDDPLLTGVNADAQGDPLGLPNLDQLGLVVYKPHRINPAIPENDPLRKVFFWRKSIRLVNTVFQFGFLNDGRMRELGETARGAMMTHTQEGNVRFDDLANPNTADIGAFIETKIDPPELKGLLDPNDPLHDQLVEDPFYTVHPSTHLEKKGQKVFEKNCMSCHNMPNVFANLEHQIGPPLNLAPSYGHSLDIGVAQANFHNLEFRHYDQATQQRTPIVIPLVKVDGTVVNYTITDDIGLAASTARYEDLHRFKVPQLRRIKDLGPYFHDNSKQTLEDVVDYFNSDAYNRSADGKDHPIHLNRNEREQLLAFLRIL